MSALKWLNKLLYMENLLGIYRKYSCQKNTKQCIIFLQIFIQSILHAAVLILETQLLLGRNHFSQLKFIYWCFSASAYINSMSTVVIGICHSRDFMSYYSSISRVSEWFMDDKKSINSQKKIIWSSIALILFSISISVFRSVEGLILLSRVDSFSIIFPIAVSLIVIRITVIFQYLMFFVNIMIVFKFFKSLTALISVAQERVGGFDISSDEQCDITRDQIQGWVELYRDLANCCDKMTLCFGRQYFFSLKLSISHYTVMMYQMFYINFLHIGERNGLMIPVILLFSSISVMVMPLVAGQKAKNQGLKFHRVLVRLYNAMILDSGEVELRLIKDFIRLIKKNPIEVKLLNKVPAGIYMLPVMLTFIVNYLIVMLQFNHII